MPVPHLSDSMANIRQPFKLVTFSADCGAHPPDLLRATHQEVGDDECAVGLELLGVADQPCHFLNVAQHELIHFPVLQQAGRTRYW